MTGFDEAAAIEVFWQAYRAGHHFLPDWHGRLGLDEAYRIQLGVLARRVAAGERQIGWKVGQTSAAGRQAFGFTEPLFGYVMQSGLRRSGHVYAPADLIAPRCEPEICVRLGRPLAGAIDAATARRAIDLVYPALEIIEIRGDIPAQKALAIADNAATKDIVLGDPVPLVDALDLPAMECHVVVNGEAAAQGRGAEVMGDPLNAIVWLAGKLAQFGLGLRQGALIMTGSITRVLPLTPGDRVRAEFAGLGAVDVAVAA